MEMIPRIAVHAAAGASGIDVLRHRQHLWNLCLLPPRQRDARGVFFC